VLPAGATVDGPVAAHLGGDSDVAVLDLALRLAAARSRPAVVHGRPGRKLAATVDALRASGLVADDGSSAAGVDVRGGSPDRAPSPRPTLWVQLGRDDGTTRLGELTDRLRTSPTRGN
jgi:hypothetical protein